MLSLYEFNKLTEEEQLLYLHDRGNHLATRHIGSYYVQLFHLSSFFVEEVRVTKSHELKDLRTFISRKHLVPYLPYIKGDIP